MSQPDLYEVFGCDKPGFTFPRSADNAGLISMLFLRLGGSLHIEANGRRGMMMPCRGLFGDEHPIPQLPETKPHEAFQSAEQWEGAMRLLDYLMHRMDPADKDFAFDAFAYVATPQERDEAMAAWKGRA